jgi:hypothetical protein
MVRKEAVKAKFEVLSRYIPRETEDNQETQESRSLGRDLNPRSSDYEAEVIPTRPQRAHENSQFDVSHNDSMTKRWECLKLIGNVY